MSTQTASFDLSSAFLDLPKLIAYGLVRGAGNLVLQQELTDKSRIGFYLLGEGPWDAILRLWINSKRVALPNPSIVHFHPGLDGVIGSGLATTSNGGDQGVDSFFSQIPGGLDAITFSRYAWLGVKVAPDPGAPSADLTVLADYQTMQVRQYDNTGAQIAFAWTQNWAWIICDYLIRKFVLREGKVNQPLTAAESARFDWASFVAAAAYYDQAIPAMLANDTFVRANANPLGGKWSTPSGYSAIQIVGNLAEPSAAAYCAAYNAAPGFASDGFSEIIIGNAATAADYVGAAYRCSGNSFYAGIVRGPLGAGAFLDIGRMSAGVWNDGSSGTFTVNPGDVLRLEVSGINLTLKINGVAKLTWTDANLSSGGAGIYARPGSATFANAAIAGWNGGSLVKRFSDGGVVYNADGQYAANVIEQMLMLCRSYQLERNGRFTLYADQPRASVFTFRSDNIQPLSFKALKSNLRTATNRLDGSFRDTTIAQGSTDDATRFAITPATVDHEAHQRAVGARGPGLSPMPKITELALDLGNNTAERAQRILTGMLARQLGPNVDANTPYLAPITAEFTGYEDSVAVEPGDVVTIDASISEEYGGKQIEVLEIDDNPDGSRGYSGLEYMPGAFPDSATPRQPLQAPQPGTGIAVPAGGANFSYRPRSNPLTAQDNGSNPVVQIATFTMTIAGVDVAISGGSASATSGDYGNTAFVYYDDPSLAGGSVVFNITFTRETALSGFARFFVGSIILPQSGCGMTIGNNDGGAGAQYTKTFRIAPVNYTLTGAWSNAANAVDIDPSTFASASSGAASCVYLASLFPSFSSLFSQNTLQVVTQITAIAGGSLLVEYSLDGGANWQTLRTASAVDAVPVASTVPIPLSVNTGNVQVRITLPGTTGGTGGSASAYAGTAADDASAGGTLAWLSAVNALGAQDNLWATATNGYGAGTGARQTHLLKLTNFGFAIPAGSTINGIYARARVRSNFFDDTNGNARYIWENSVRLYKAGALAGTDHSTGTSWPTAGAVRSYGGSTDLWGAAWAVADINDAGFGIGLSATLDNEGTYSGSEAWVDFAQITIYYTTATGSQSQTTRIFDIAQLVTF